MNENDILVLAGSVPYSVPDSIYKVIMNRLSDKKVLIVVDASNDLLVNVLENHPFLIKPNSFELGEIFGKVIHDRKDIMKHAKLLQQMGARNVLVSMAGDGAILACLLYTSLEKGNRFRMPLYQPDWYGCNHDC